MLSSNNFFKGSETVSLHGMLGSCSLLERFCSVQLHIMAPRRKQQENGRNKNTSPSKGNNSKQSRKRHEDPQENCGTSVKCTQTWSYLAFICVVGKLSLSPGTVCVVCDFTVLLYCYSLYFKL